METLFDESANRNNPSFLFCPGDKRPSRDQHLPPRWFVDRRGGIFFHVETSDDADPSKTWGESVVRLANHFFKNTIRVYKVFQNFQSNNYSYFSLIYFIYLFECNKLVNTRSFFFFLVTDADLLYDTLRRVNIDFLIAGEKASEFLAENLKAKVAVLNNALNKDDSKTAFSSRDEHPDWFQGLETNCATKVSPLPLLLLFKRE